MLKLFLILSTVFWAYLCAQADSLNTECAIAHSAIQRASAVRGLKVLHDVPCKLSDKEDVIKYLKETIDKKISKEKMKYEELVFKAIGLIPEDFDYVNGVIKLYSDQLGGYYDPERKHYVMAKWLPGAMQFPIAIHELTHALQDQHFDLKIISDYDKESSDSLMARSALIEGDASAVMTDYARKQTRQALLRDDPNIDKVLLENIGGVMLASSLSKTPSALQALLVFPYVSGLRFVHGLLRSGGYEEVDNAFKRLPRSCEEILHPEKYRLKAADFSELEPFIPNGAKAKVLYDDRLGEFLVSSLLGSYISPAIASTAAAGWGGDKVAVIDIGKGKHVITWNAAWDTDRDALEFYDALTQAYNKRFSEIGIVVKDKATWNSRDKVTTIEHKQKFVILYVN